MLLTTEQVAAISGYKRKKFQIDWLCKNGIRFVIAADGSPRVLQSHIRELLCNTNSQKSKRAQEPNFHALKQMTGSI